MGPEIQSPIHNFLVENGGPLAVINIEDDMALQQNNQNPYYAKLVDSK
jgi:hypothetical protein